MVTLSDDDEEQPLFAARDLVPGSRRTRCLTVTYAGTAEVVQVQVLVEGGGELARWLRVHVDLGDVPGRDCAAFVPVRPLLDGTLEALADQTAPGAAMTYEARSGVPVGLRVTTELPADVPSSAAGAAAYGSFRFGVS